MPTAVTAEEIRNSKKQTQRPLVVEPWIPAHLGDLWIALKKGILNVAHKKDSG